MLVRDELATQQGSWSQTMQSNLCPAARFSSYELQFSPVWLKSNLSYSTKHCSACLGKSTRHRKADVSLLGCSEAGLGSSGGRTRSSSNSGYCNPQPCCSSKTIAGLMHTLDDVRDTAQTECAAWARAAGASGEQRDSNGNSFVTKCTRPKTTQTFCLPARSSSSDTAP